AQRLARPALPTRRSSDLEPVVQVAREADPFLLRAERPEAAEPPGVVDRERQHLGEAGEEAGVALVEVERVRVLQSQQADRRLPGDRKSTRLNSSHVKISY